MWCDVPTVVWCDVPTVVWCVVPTVVWCVVSAVVWCVVSAVGWPLVFSLVFMFLLCALCGSMCKLLHGLLCEQSVQGGVPALESRREKRKRR